MKLFTRYEFIQQPVFPFFPAARVAGLWIILICLTAPFCFGQFQEVPLTGFYTTTPEWPSVRQARITALKLPFFDDFSTARNQQPDPALWQVGRNVYVNNTLTVNHPSVNVATFDGVQASGRPYDLTNPNADGPTDTLTSQPIDLTGLSAADAGSLYLSFYWQQRGLGELPDVGDSLTLEFLTSQGRWRRVWNAVGGTPNSNFTQEVLAVSDPAYLHAAFQFRFRSYGRRSGRFDAWHLDYVYLNKGRSASDRFVRDVTTRMPVSPYLKRYTAMPLRQYLANPAAETADTVRTDIVNLFNNFNNIRYRLRVRDEVSGQVIQDSPPGAAESIGSLRSRIVSARPSPLPTSFSGRRAVLRTTFDVLTTDDQNPSIPTVDLRRNDTLSVVTVLDNYFAYDDGTAESGLQINQRQGRAALRFIASQPDVLAGVQLCLVPFLTDLTGRNFVVSVWDNQNGRPGRALYQKAFQVRYPTTRNGFVDFKFDYGVAVKDTFYVGWTQLGEDGFLALGYDRNSPFGRQVFVNLSTVWDAANLPGVPMLRPLTGGDANAPITSAPEPAAVMQVYPNPSSWLLNWDNPAIIQIDVFDTGGRLRHSFQPSPDQRQTDLSSLPAGLYLIRMSDGRQVRTQKVILAR